MVYIMIFHELPQALSEEREKDISKPKEKKARFLEGKRFPIENMKEKRKKNLR